MEKNTLISMVDFVFLMKKDREMESSMKFWSCDKYAKFLSLTLTLSMFVPCDENGNVLPSTNQFLSCEKGFFYGKAKEKVLFEGFIISETTKDPKFVQVENGRIKIVFDTTSESKMTIEDLSRNAKLTLTESATKQIYG